MREVDIPLRWKALLIVPFEMWMPWLSFLVGQGIDGAFVVDAPSERMRL